MLYVPHAPLIGATIPQDAIGATALRNLGGGEGLRATAPGWKGGFGEELRWGCIKTYTFTDRTRSLGVGEYDGAEGRDYCCIRDGISLHGTERVIPCISISIQGE